MNNRTYLQALFVLVAFLTAPFVFADGNAQEGAAQHEGAEVESRVSALLTKHNSTLISTKTNKSGVQFLVKFSFDPNTSPNQTKIYSICWQILELNDYKPFIIKSQGDKIYIFVKWNKKRKEMDISFGDI